eukprot:scaffold3440_cov316-Prasinococcus_capsulatus_cf.AAC.10
MVTVAASLSAGLDATCVALGVELVRLSRLHASTQAGGGRRVTQRRWAPAARDATGTWLLRTSEAAGSGASRQARLRAASSASWATWAASCKAKASRRRQRWRRWCQSSRSPSSTSYTFAASPRPRPRALTILKLSSLISAWRWSVSATRSPSASFPARLASASSARTCSSSSDLLASSTYAAQPTA